MLSSKPHFFPHNFLRHRVACVMIGGIEGSMPSSKPLLEGSMLSSKPHLFAYKLSVGALYGSVLTGAVCSELIQLSE